MTALAIQEAKDLLASTPAPIQWAVFGGQLTCMNYEGMKQVTAALRECAAGCAELGHRARMAHAALGNTISNTEIAVPGRQLAALLTGLAEIFHSLADQTETTSADDQKNFIQSAFFAFYTFCELALYTAGGAAPLAAVKLAAKHEQYAALRNVFLAKVVALGTSAAAKRALLFATGFGLGSAGLDWYIQELQINRPDLMGTTRTELDTQSIAVAGAQGAAAVLAGTAGGRLLGPKAAGFLGRAAFPTVAAVSGVAGAVGGALAAGAVTGQVDITLDSILQGLAGGLTVPGIRQSTLITEQLRPHGSGIDPALRAEHLTATMNRAKASDEIGRTTRLRAHVWRLARDLEADAEAADAIKRSTTQLQRWDTQVARLDAAVDASAAAQPRTPPPVPAIVALRTINALAGRDVTTVPAHSGSRDLSTLQLQTAAGGRMLRVPGHKAMVERLTDRDDSATTAIVVEGSHGRPFVLAQHGGAVFRIDPYSGLPTTVFDPPATGSVYAILFENSDNGLQPVHPIGNDYHVLPQTEHSYSHRQHDQAHVLYAAGLAHRHVIDRCEAMARELGIDPARVGDKQRRAELVRELRTIDKREAGTVSPRQLRRELIRLDKIEAQSAALHKLGVEQKAAQLDYFHRDSTYRRLEMTGKSDPQTRNQLAESAAQRNQSAKKVARLDNAMDSALAAQRNKWWVVDAMRLEDACIPISIIDARHITDNTDIHPIQRDVSPDATNIFETAAALGACPQKFNNHDEIAELLADSDDRAIALVQDQYRNNGHGYIITKSHDQIVVSDLRGALLHAFPPEGRGVLSSVYAFIIDGKNPLLPMEPRVRAILQDLSKTTGEYIQSLLDARRQRDTLAKRIVKNPDTELAADNLKQTVTKLRETADKSGREHTMQSRIDRLELASQQCNKIADDIAQLRIVGQAMAFNHTEVAPADVHDVAVAVDHISIIPSESIRSAHLPEQQTPKLLEPGALDDLFRTLEPGGKATISVATDISPSDFRQRLQDAGFDNIDFTRDGDSTAPIDTPDDDGNYHYRAQSHKNSPP